jgi:hypothetical protein
VVIIGSGYGIDLLNIIERRINVDISSLACTLK